MDSVPQARPCGGAFSPPRVAPVQCLHDWRTVLGFSITRFQKRKVNRDRLRENSCSAKRVRVYRP